MKAIVNGIILKDNKFLENFIILFDKQIVDIIGIDDYIKIKSDINEEYDAKGNYVLPGFIDQHIHGFGGYDVMDNKEESIIEIKKALVKNGVTSFLPTTITASRDELQKVCDIVEKVKISNEVGAKIIGVHLEGPYINIKKKGAQNEKYIVSPDFEFIEKNKDILKIVTFAPEIEDSLELVQKYSEFIKFQIGHTDATYEEANRAVEAGAKGFTHTFNAMTGIHHRDLGAVGSCFLNDDVYAEIVCDNIHLNKDLYNLVIKNKGINKVLLVTDCISAGGLNDGEYSLGGLKVFLKDGACRLEDGVLAGSVLKLNNALKNIVENSKEDLINCLKMVTENQAKYLGLENEIGKIEKGYCSDIVIMDKYYEIQKTFVDGECCYEI